MISRKGQPFQVDGKRYKIRSETREVSHGSDGTWWTNGYDVLSGPTTIGFVWKEETYWRAIAIRQRIGKMNKNIIAVTVFKTMKDAARWTVRA